MQQHALVINQKSIITKALQGDQRAYYELYTTYVEDVFQFLMQFSRDRDMVADWTQQAFAKAFKNLSRFEHRANFKTWLFSIAINEMKMSNRKWKNWLNVAGDSVEIPDRAESRDLDQWITIQDEIEKLDDQKKMVFLLYEVEGYSHKEIGEMLEIKESTSRTILTRTKAKLRESLIGD